MLRILGVLLSFVIAMFALAAPAAAGVADLSNADAVNGLKQALTDGSAAAVKMLGQDNGYFGNAKVKIPLPPNMQKIEMPMLEHRMAMLCPMSKNNLFGMKL
jgi:K+-transporting ATPase A subunit